jgi:hypothetical protein
LYPSSYIERFDAVAEVGDGRVCWIIGTKNMNRLFDAVICVNIINGDDCKCFVITRISKSNASAGHYAETLDISRRHVEGDRHCKECAIRQS